MNTVRIVLAVLLCAPLLCAAEPASPADAEAEYARAIDKRANDIVKALELSDAEQAAKVHGILIAQYRALRDWHDVNDAKLKDKSATAQEKQRVTDTLKALHDDFLARLSAELTPQQVDIVKDKLTYNVLHVTYNAYCEKLPQLTDAQKAYMMAQLKEAREIAMDQGSSEEKHAVFGKYKGRINNYLAKEGYDLKKADKEWAERRKAAAASQKQQEAKQP